MKAERADRAYTGDALVDHLLFRWGRVIAGSDGWARGFALSIQRARKKPGWTPTPKQLSVMQRMVAELPITSNDEDADLIEES